MVRLPLFTCLILLSAPLSAADPADIEKFKNTRSCVECDLSGADLTDIFADEPYSLDDPKVNLDGADLTDTNFKGAFLYQGSFKGARMDGADLRGADLTGAQMYLASMTNTKMGNSDIRWTNLAGADLTKADLTGATGVDLDGANLCNTTMSDGSVDVGTCDEDPS